MQKYESERKLDTDFLICDIIKGAVLWNIGTCMAREN